MTELLPIQGLYAIEVPEDAERFEISIQPDDIPCVTYWFGKNIDPSVISLPPGSYELLFTTKNCTEEQAGTVIDQQMFLLYRDYTIRSANWWACETRKDSLQSLLRSHNLTASNYLLIKRINQEK